MEIDQGFFLDLGHALAHRYVFHDENKEPALFRQNDLFQHYEPQVTWA
jgi:hypothetical protein